MCYISIWTFWCIITWFASLSVRGLQDLGRSSCITVLAREIWPDRMLYCWYILKFYLIELLHLEALEGFEVYFLEKYENWQIIFPKNYFKMDFVIKCLWFLFINYLLLCSILLQQLLVSYNCDSTQIFSQDTILKFT